MKIHFKNTLQFLTYFAVGFCLILQGNVYAQSNLKEGFNQYALYSKSGDVKLLDAARKFSDEAFKTRKDTLAFRNNLLRGLVYSSLAIDDSNRTKKYPEDPIIIATRALSNLKDRQLAYESEPEINHIRRHLSNARLIVANKAMQSENYETAYAEFRIIDSIGALDNPDVTYNLAVLANKLGKLQESASYYQRLISKHRGNKPSYYHALADIYEQTNDKQLLLNTLIEANKNFSKDLKTNYRLLHFYNNEQEYEIIANKIDEVIKLSPEDPELYYLAGHAQDVLGNFNTAKGYYEQLLRIEPNNYVGNFAIGLIYLRKYLEDKNNTTNQIKAEEYLLRANQINPTGKNTLQSLAILYENEGNIIQLERVNQILNQLTLN